MKSDNTSDLDKNLEKVTPRSSYWEMISRISIAYNLVQYQKQVISYQDPGYCNVKHVILCHNTKVWLVLEAHSLHAVHFSPISQFEQCHKYVLAGAYLWPDCVIHVVLASCCVVLVWSKEVSHWGDWWWTMARLHHSNLKLITTFLNCNASPQIAVMPVLVQNITGLNAHSSTCLFNTLCCRLECKNYWILLRLYLLLSSILNVVYVILL
jgi:hypothetical protein